MATLEGFDARSLALDFSPLLQIKQALDQNKNRALAERKLALDEEVRRGNLDIQEADLILREEAGDLAGRKFESGQASQQSIQDTLAQLINPQQAPTGQADPGQAVQPGGVPAPVAQPSRRTQAISPEVLAKQDKTLLALAGTPGGTQIANVAEKVFKGRNERAKEEFAKFVTDKKRFALSIKRMDTREKQDRAIKNEITKQSRTPGGVDPFLPELLNMNNADREQSLFLDLAQGDLLDDLAKTSLATKDQFVPVLNDKGEVVAQKNLKTGEVKKTPQATGGLGEKATFTKSPGVVIELPDGTFAQAIPVIDTRTGKTVNKIVPLQGKPVSRLGESGEQLTARKIREAGGKARSVGEQKRIQLDIDDGIAAAKGMGVINRSIGLMKDLETGGFDAIKVRAKQILGVETADEAELTANLGKSILAQLRPIFGSQFTEREGATLNRIEANFGKSTKGNVRLLNQLKQLVQRAAKRGIAAAKVNDDFRSAIDIQDLMEFVIQDVAPETITEAPASPPPAGGGGGNKIGRFTVEVE
jgi:hypothetical protein